ncbi:hypothetical protein LTR50_003695 [Elasticomyces elasticus]|nr:hypothetical protein LTR50_003695 [Elasticomyces elasticus]
MRPIQRCIPARLSSTVGDRLHETPRVGTDKYDDNCPHNDDTVRPPYASPASIPSTSRPGAKSPEHTLRAAPWPVSSLQTIPSFPLPETRSREVAQGERKAPRVMDSRNTRQDETAGRSQSMGDPEGSDNTPRSEAPARTPSSPYMSQSAEESYFSLKRTGGGAASGRSSRLSSANASPVRNANASTTSANSGLSGLQHLLLSPESACERPVPQRDLSSMSAASVESTDSSVTVIPTTYRIDQHAQSYRRPTFPNQAHSALQQQLHPPPHLPPPLRTRSSHPAQPLNFSAAIAALHQSGSRTVGNSPAVTPGLFSPTSPRLRPTYTPTDEQGGYSSPYLHFTHRQAPKETHIADVDVDPISGRKIINNYEIIDELGRGTHGKVKLGRCLDTNEFVAIKIVERYSRRRRLGRLGNAEDKVKREVAILKKARHPNIVALLEVIDDPARKKVYIVLEHVELGEIAWRVEAPKDIALIESRRYDREASGIFEDPVAEAEDQNILIEGGIRRDTLERRKLRQLKRMRRAAHVGTDAWSLEYGGDTEDEDSDMEQASRISSGTTDTNNSISRFGPRRTSRAHTPLPDEPDLPPLDDVQEIPNTADDAACETQGTVPENVAHGAFDAGSNITRTASVAGSSHSHLAERKHNGPHPRSGRQLLDADIIPDYLYAPCMSFQAARVAFRDTVLGLQYLHYQGIIHRDIKPPNLLQTGDHRVKISDFGVSYLGRPAIEEHAENLSESDAQDFDEAKELARTVGTAAFYAPELCYTDVTTDAPPVGKAIDVWALGVTLFCMIFGRTPFIDTEFVVMRRIADEEIYIPNRRLQAVEPKPKSRSSSHGRVLPVAASGKRAEDELAYEEVEPELLDLLKKLLTKNPTDRITLEEVKHHPWVVYDIANPAEWLDETEPSRQSQGKKIEVSKEDLNEAVIPLRIVERIRSGVARMVGGALGLGRAATGSRRRRRARAPSSAGSDPQSSAASPISAASQDNQCVGSRGDESILSALKASREGEHPLSQSVTASPELAEHRKYFDKSFLASQTEAFRHQLDQTAPPSSSDSRQSSPERVKPVASTAGSPHTIRASDVPGGRPGGTTPTSSGLPSTPVALESPGGSHLGGLFGGTGHYLLKSVREKDTTGKASDSETKSSPDRATPSNDPHAEPSLAISGAVAAGRVDLPDALQDISPGSGTFNSPTSPHSYSIPTWAGHTQIFQPNASISRNDSLRSSTSDSGPSASHYRERLGPLDRADESSRSILVSAPSEERFRRAEEQMMRRHISNGAKRPASALTQRRSSGMTPQVCPPSPDDDIFFQRTREQADRIDRIDHLPSLETSPTSQASHSSHMLPPITPSSSDDRFTPDTSVSNPSMPSMTSANSLAQRDDRYIREIKGDLLSSDETALPDVAPHEDYEGYDGDHAVESGDDYDDLSSDDDGGLEMVRRKSAAQRTDRSYSVTMAEIARRGERRETATSLLSMRRARSGSSNALEKIRTHSEGDREGDRGRPHVVGHSP